MLEVMSSEGEDDIISSDEEGEQLCLEISPECCGAMQFGHAGGKLP